MEGVGGHLRVAACTCQSRKDAKEMGVEKKFERGSGPRDQKGAPPWLSCTMRKHMRKSHLSWTSIWGAGSLNSYPQEGPSLSGVRIVDVPVLGPQLDRGRYGQL